VIVYFFTGILTFSNLLLALTKKHSKVIAMFLLLFMWLLFWGNTMNPDYDFYANLYLDIRYNAISLDKVTIEPGFVLIMKLCSLLGLNYNGFLALTVLCCYLMIHSTVKLFSRNYNYVYLLYFIFPFFLDVIQIRNFIVMTILIYSIKYLFNGTTRDKIICFVLLFIATSFHRIALAYFPFLFINAKKRNLFVYIIAVCSITFSILFLLNNKEIPLLSSYIERLIGYEKYSAYFQSKARLGSILFCYLQLISFMLVLLSKQLCLKYARDPHNIITYQYVKLLYYINFLSFIYLPFLILNVNFTRLIRNITLLNYIVFANTSSVIRKVDIKILYNMCVIILVLSFFIILILHLKDEIIKSVMFNNIFHIITR